MFLYKHFVDGKTCTVLEDVVRNLGHVLRTKRGAGYFLQNFGLTETGFRTSEEMVNTLTAEITENIRLFEPRVELLEVDDEDDDDTGRARLVVRLRLRDSTEKLRLVVDLAGGKFDIQIAPET
jgi:predicted component of type VI protein secretion system